MRLIDAEFTKRLAERLIKDEEECYNTSPKSWAEEIENFKCLIDSIPTIEAKPIIHAHWNYDGEDDWTGLCSWFCSNCGSFIETEEDTLSYSYNFCPDCGAQMDEKESD